MSLRGLFASAVGIAVAAIASPAMAGYTTVDVSGYVNTNTQFGADTYPVGTSSGNQGTGIPFNIAAYGNSGYGGSWIAPGSGSTLTIDLSGLNISGQASFYALLNNYYGTPNANEYKITITGKDINTNAIETVTYNSIGGVDTRDYYNNVFTNGISVASTTTEWFKSHVLSTEGNLEHYVRLDVREFDLPAIFSDDDITSFSITQLTGDSAVFSGLTFSSESAVTFGVPEPATLALLGMGLVGLGVMRRRKGHAVV